MISNSFLNQNLRKSVNNNADKTKVVNIISRAFDNDPVFNWIVGQDQKQRRIRKLIESSVKLTTPFEETYISTEKREFVPRYPNDDPAEKLLEKIKQQKEQILKNKVKTNKLR